MVTNDAVHNGADGVCPGKLKHVGIALIYRNNSDLRRDLVYELTLSPREQQGHVIAIIVYCVRECEKGLFRSRAIHDYSDNKELYLATVFH